MSPHVLALGVRAPLRAGGSFLRSIYEGRESGGGGAWRYVPCELVFFFFFFFFFQTRFVGRQIAPHKSCTRRACGCCRRSCLARTYTWNLRGTCVFASICAGQRRIRDWCEKGSSRATTFQTRPQSALETPPTASGLVRVRHRCCLRARVYD